MHAAQEVQSVANLDDIRVVTVDSRNERRHVMRRLLELCVDQAEIGEADSREAAVELVGRCRPEVVVLEIAMPLDEGLGTITAVRPSSSTEKTTWAAARVAWPHRSTSTSGVIQRMA